jgi:hypothetical protein
LFERGVISAGTGMGVCAAWRCCHGALTYLSRDKTAQKASYVAMFRNIFAQVATGKIKFVLEGEFFCLSMNQKLSEVAKSEEQVFEIYRQSRPCSASLANYILNIETKMRSMQFQGHKYHMLGLIGTF